MNEECFDQMTRRVAGGLSRRKLLRNVAGSAVLAIGSLVGLGSTLRTSTVRAASTFTFPWDGSNGRTLAFVGGHEHSLQIHYALEPTDPTYSVVSGSASKMSTLGSADGLQFASAAPGYMRLVVAKDGTASLFVEASPPEYQVCPEDARLDACMAAGVASFQTVHAQRLR